MTRKHRYRPITLALLATGVFLSVPCAFAAEQGSMPPAKAHKKKQDRAISVGEVANNIITTSAYSQKTEELPSQKRIFHSEISSKILGRAEIEAAGPAAGGAQLLNFAPGVSTLASYGTGAAKAQSALMGSSRAGVGNPKGSEAAHSIAISFDGIPMNNPATGLWQPSQVDQPSIF
ncbi:MAG: hypothetical protein JJ714_10590 [Acidithiobacillus sp.]|nr:hypothetical protein [Acidithiobacillus sp.]